MPNTEVHILFPDLGIWSFPFSWSLCARLCHPLSKECHSAKWGFSHEWGSILNSLIFRCPLCQLWGGGQDGNGWGKTCLLIIARCGTVVADVCAGLRGGPEWPYNVYGVTFNIVLRTWKVQWQGWYRVGPARLWNERTGILERWGKGSIRTAREVW